MRIGFALAIGCLVSVPAVGQSIHPRFSPDDQSVVFYNRTDNTASVELIDLASGEQRTLLSDDGYYGNPGFIGDSSDIVLAGSLDGMRGGWDVFRLRSDGSLVQMINTPQREMHASASPLGNAIVFVRFDDDGANLIELDIESGDERALTVGNARNFHPKYSVDGRRIVFDRTMDDATGVFQIDLLTGEASPLYFYPDGSVRAFAPALSPDGEFLALVRMDESGTHLVIHNLESGHDHTLLSSESGLGGPHWSSDGSLLVYHHQVEAGFQIEMVDVASGSITVLAAPDE